MNTLNPEQIHFLQEDEFLPSISPWITLGGMFLVLVFGAAVGLASVLKFSITVKAPATIRPAGELRLVQSGIEGTIEQINVEENQVVKQGAVVAQLDDSRLQTKKSQLQGDIQWGTLQLSQITAQLRALDNQIISETTLVKRSIAAAEASLLQNQRNYQELQITTQADLEEAQAGYKLASEEYKRYQQLQESGAIAELQVREKEANLEAATARIRRLKASINPTDATIAKALEQIAQEKARGGVTLAGLRRQQEQVLQQRLEIQNQIQRARKELLQVENDFKGTTIRASIDGTILQLNLRNVGQVVQPGTAIAQIAPRNAPLVIKARVSAQDINKVDKGKTVQMRVSACPYPDYGTLKGTVQAVSPDAISSDGNGAATASQAFYEVRIQPRNLFVGTEKHWCRLQFGMEGRADIVSRRETVLQFVLKKARLLTNL